MTGKRNLEPLKGKYTGKSWDLWVEDLETKSESTQYIYLTRFVKFLDFLGKTPEEFFEAYKLECESPDSRDIGTTATQVKTFMKQLEDKGYSKNYTKTVLNSVRSFLTRMNLLPLKVNGLKKARPKERKAATPEEIRTLINSTHYSKRNIGIILVAKDSGLRVSDIPSIQIKHISKAMDKGLQFHCFDLQTKKEGVWAQVVLGPESLKAIKDILEERERLGITVDPDSYLFISKVRQVNAEKIDGNTISYFISRLCEKTGLSEISAHSLRRFHTTACQYGGIDSLWIKKMQGKALDESMNGYVKPTPPMLLEKYESAYPKLSIFGGRVEKSVVNGLRSELKETEGWVAANQAAFSRMEKENEKLRADIDELTKTVKLLSEKLG